jgi:hypothetical protein
MAKLVKRFERGFEKVNFSFFGIERVKMTLDFTNDFLEKTVWLLPEISIFVLFKTI